MGVTAGTGTDARIAVSGAFTLTITYPEEVNGLTSSRISPFPSGAVSVTTGPTKSTADAKIWTATITPSTAGNFTLTVHPAGVTPATGNNIVNSSPTRNFYYDGPPTFSAATSAVSGAENTSTSTDLATLNATDINSHTISYAITGGADSTNFQIADTNKLRFSAVPDFESPTDAVSATPANAANNNEYIVVVTASSTATIGGGVNQNYVELMQTLTGTQTVTVTVTDVNEPPSAPSAPMVTAATATPQQLSVSWSAPTNTGPAISDYDVRYRTTGPPAGLWQDAGFTGTGTSTTLMGLTQGTAYQVQVRATNAEGTGSWSDSGRATTAANVAPVFDSATTAFNVAENSTAVTTATATDADSGDVVSYAMSGADSTQFSINTSTGAVTFTSAPDYEAPTDVVSVTPPNAAGNNVYVVTITALSGTGARALSVSKTLLVTVTDVGPPGKPAVPQVTAMTPTSVSISWSAPPNTVLAISGYDVQYRQGSSGAFTSHAHTGIGTSTVLTGLTENAAYQIQVRATHVEGTGPWSDAVTAVPQDSTSPVFDSSAAVTVTVAENTPVSTAIVTVVAMDADPADEITGYALSGTDSGAFTLDSSSGVLRFRASPDYEHPTDVAHTSSAPTDAADAAGNNTYIVLITATSGTGWRQLSETQRLTITVTNVDEMALGLDIGSSVAMTDARYLTSEPSWTVTFDFAAPLATVGDAAFSVSDISVSVSVSVSGGAGEATFGELTLTDAARTIYSVPVTVSREGTYTFQVKSGSVSTLSGDTYGGAGTPLVVIYNPPVVFLPPIETVQPVKPTQIPRTPLIFNEIGNGAAGANDWVELRNVTAEAVPLKNWGISIVADGQKVDEPLSVFPSDAAFSVPPNGILLVTQRPPDKTRLAGGSDIASPGKQGAVHQYFVAPEFTLPDDGQFLLILRNAKGKLGKGENVIDVAGGGGPNTDAFIAETGNAFQTDIWPLKATAHPREDTGAALAEGKVWRRAKADSVGYHKDAWTQAAYTGVGYDRVTETSPATAGTPGYPNDAVKPVAATPKGSVTFSEIMVDSAGGKLPQWIELYNNSKTDAINLNRWKLEIQNVDSADLIGRPIVTLTLGEKVIQPNQTLLIVAGPARASSDAYLPADRVYDLLALHDKNLRIKRARDTFLSAEGFYLQLTDREGHLVDEVGNTDGNRRTDDEPAWAFPLNGEAGVRSSLIRRYTDGTSVAEDGKQKANWVLAANVKKVVAGGLHWGDADDVGTPGHRRGGALPVELSRFSLTRTEAGAVVLTWTTESEVDNAGFNLRRSEKRASGFTLLNTALIAGAGTTGERQTYTFTDTSAKPGVEYYYQLEEVAFDGKQETLAMRLLRGPVSASNRLLTTFGEVKKTK